jgi:hypothetical protein
MMSGWQPESTGPFWREDEFSQPVTLFGGSKRIPQLCRGRERREMMLALLLAMTEKSPQRRPHIGHGRTQRGITASRSRPWGARPAELAVQPSELAALGAQKLLRDEQLQTWSRPNEMPRSVWLATSARLTQHGSRTLRHRTCRRSRSICGGAPTCCAAMELNVHA